MLSERKTFKLVTGKINPKEPPLSPEVPADAEEGSLYTVCSCGQLIPRDVNGTTIRCRTCRAILSRHDNRRKFQKVSFNFPLSLPYDPGNGSILFIHGCGERISIPRLTHTRNVSTAIRCRRCGEIILPYAYRCPECGIACANQRDLEIHMVDHPPGSREP